MITLGGGLVNPALISASRAGFLLHPSIPSAAMAKRAAKNKNEILIKILDKLETMDGRLGKLEQGQSELRADVSQLKDDVSVPKCDAAGLKGDVEIIKEDTRITRSAFNDLLAWAEDAAAEVKIPLY
ncbi:hypothetical protein CE91St46_33600 [Eubacteriales bacterium]|nr:hypothetical protein CE91St46_33600 [Eubacteriales bacterium]GKH64969.1 hypothetical protein CE91St47_34380 [Eubacteriales bacterium]